MTPHHSARGASASPRNSVLTIAGCAALVAAVVWSASSCSHSKNSAANDGYPPSLSTSSSTAAAATTGLPAAAGAGSASTSTSGSGSGSSAGGTAGSPTASASQDPQVLKDATAAINTLNTMDYRTVDTDLQAWLAATSGDLHSQMTQTTAMLKLQFADQHVTMGGRILTIRVDAEDPAAGTAQVSGTDDVRITSPGSDKTNHDRFQAQLVRTGGGWKLSRYDNAAVA